MPLDSSRTLTRLLSVLVSLVLTVIGGIALAAPATAVLDAPTVTSETVAGKVVNSSSVGIAGVAVTLYKPVLNGGGVRIGFQAAASATTAADGTYTIVAPGAGTYRLGFASTGFEPRFYPSALSVGEADDVVVQAGQALTGRNVDLLKPAVVSAKITLANGAVYSGGGTVSVLRQVFKDPVTGANGSSWTTAASATLDSTGSYTITAPGATYRVRLSLPQHGVGYLPNMGGLNAGAGFTLASESATSGAVIPLPAISNISGRVLDDEGTGVPGSTVTLQYALVDQILDGQPVSQWATLPGGTTSGSGGAWALDALNRTYRVRASGSLNGTPYTNFYPAAATVQTASDVPVTGPVTGIDVVVGSTPLTAVTNVTAPWVEGEAKGGSALTAHPGTWLPATGVTFAYQWLENGTPIPGATAATYGIPFLSSGGTYAVSVTATATGLTAGTAASLSTGPAASAFGAGAFENRALPVITGKARTGATLTASSGEWSTTPTGVSYQWSADGVDIAGATQATYLLTPALLGRLMRVRVVATSASGPATSTSVPTAAVTVGPLRNSTLPAITGTAQVGQVLTATPGTWSGGDGVTFTYKWLADGAPVAGATSTTFTPTAAQIGKRMAVRVTASKTGYSQGVADSAGTEAVASLNPFTLVTAPAISGAPQVGSTLSASTGTWTPTPTSFDYQWKAADAVIAGATAATYVPTSADVGKTITVTVTAHKADTQDGVATSAPTAAVTTVPITVVGGPSVSGSARVGSTLEASPGTVTPTGVTVTYQWLRSGAPITGAVAQTYAVTTADLGERLRVQATYTRTGSDPVVSTSRPTGPAKSTPQLTVQGFSGDGSARLRVSVQAEGVSPVSGVIRIFERGRKVAEQALVNGRVTVRVSGLSKGLHSFVVKLVRGGDVATGSTTSTVRVD